MFFRRRNKKKTRRNLYEEEKSQMDKNKRSVVLMVSAVDVHNMMASFQRVEKGLPNTCTVFCP